MPHNPVGLHGLVCYRANFTFFFVLLCFLFLFLFVAYVTEVTFYSIALKGQVTVNKEFGQMWKEETRSCIV
jgi:hypothetical protein